MPVLGNRGNQSIGTKEAAKLPKDIDNALKIGDAVDKKTKIPEKGKESQSSNSEVLKLQEKTSGADISTLLSSPSLLYEIAIKLEKQGYIGELQNKLATYLAGTTKDYPRDERICIISEGESGGGKSKITIVILERYFPDCVKSFSRMTGHAAEYWAKEIGTLDGVILLIKQMEGAQDMQYSMQIMTDTTSGGLKLLTVTGKSEDMKTKEITLNGFPVMCSTVYNIGLDPQILRRFYTMCPDDSPEQTQRILLHKARLLQDPEYKRIVETTDTTLLEIPRRLKNESAKLGVVVPFAEVVAKDVFPWKNILARSDFDKFFDYIKAITHLHYKQRLSYIGKDGKLILISSPMDYYYAWKVVEASLPKRLTGITDEKTTRILDIVQQFSTKENGISTIDVAILANEQGKPYSKMTVWATLKDLKEKGYVNSERKYCDKRNLLWKLTNKTYDKFEVKMPNKNVENAYMQFIADKIGNDLSEDNTDLFIKSMTGVDLVTGSEITDKIFSQSVRDMMNKQ